MNRIGRALIFIGQVILFLVVLALIVIASILLYDAFVYALTLIGIPKIVAQLIIAMLCLFVTIGGQYGRYYFWIEISFCDVLLGVQSHTAYYVFFLYRDTFDMVVVVIWIAWTICADYF